MLIGTPLCPPLEGVEKVHQACKNLLRSTLTTLEKNRDIKTVVLSIASRLLVPSSTLSAHDRSEFPEAEDVFLGLSKTISSLQTAGKQVVFMMDNPVVTQSPELCIPRPFHFEHSTHEQCSLPKETFIKNTRDYRLLVKRLQGALPRLLVYDPIQVLCGETNCDVLRNNRSMYSYQDHLSDYGSNLVAEDFLNWLGLH